MTTADDKDDAASQAEAEAAFDAIDVDELEKEVEALLADPTMKEVIEQTLAPYLRVLLPAALEHARREIAVHFIADPAAARALEEARATAKSRVVPVRNSEALRTAAKRAKIKAGRKP